MKKNLLTLILLCITCMAFAQENTKNKKDSVNIADNLGGKNEIRANLLMGILAIPEISYERLFDDNTGLGISVSLGLDDDVEYKLGFVPYYRVYFGNAKRSSGFFIEANAAVMQTKENVYWYYYQDGNTMRAINDTRWNVGLGAAAGGKFLTKSGFIGELSLGLGRFFNRKNDGLEGYPRVGITIGKRF